MSVQDERFYVRFKGRVLGPLTREKTLELAKRGQITKQHELSPDGVAWKQAQEFPELFAIERAATIQAATKEKQHDTTAPQGPAEEWYAHFENSNQGPVDLKGMKNWIALGAVNRETLIWRPGMSEWQPAELIRAEWFSERQASKTKIQSTGVSSSNIDADSQGKLIETLLKLRLSVLFLAITGIVIGTAWMIASLAGFFMIASLGGNEASNVMSILFSIVQLATSISWFTASIFLLQFGNKLSALLYRSEMSDVEDGLKALLKFWKFTAIVVLVWLIIVLVLGAISYLVLITLGRSL